jgi:hypothetical protein
MRHAPVRDPFFIYREMTDCSIPALAYFVSSQSQNASKTHSRKETTFPKASMAPFCETLAEPVPFYEAIC